MEMSSRNSIEFHGVILDGFAKELVGVGFELHRWKSDREQVTFISAKELCIRTDGPCHYYDYGLCINVYLLNEIINILVSGILNMMKVNGNN